MTNQNELASDLYVNPEDNEIIADSLGAEIEALSENVLILEPLAIVTANADETTTKDSKDGPPETTNVDIIDNENTKLGVFSLTLPEFMSDGDADYTVTLSTSGAGIQYNFAFIIDVSGSMQGDKLDDAKRAYIALINLLIERGIASNSTFAVIAFNTHATLQANLTADQAISAIDGLSAGGRTSFAPAILEGINFFTEKTGVNIAYFLSDGKSTSSGDDPKVWDDLKPHADVRAYGIGMDADIDQLNKIDSNTAVQLDDSNDLEAEFQKSGFSKDDISVINITYINAEGNEVVEAIDPRQLEEGPLGLSFSGQIDQLNEKFGEETEVTAEIVFQNNFPSVEVEGLIKTGIDLYPLQVEGNFSFNDEKYTASGEIQIGLKADDFTALVKLDGNLSYDNETIAANGIVTAQLGGIIAPLFQGDFGITVGERKTNSLVDTFSSSETQFSLGGLGIQFNNLAFVEGQIELQGAVTTTEELGGLTINIDGDNKVIFNSDCVSVTGGELLIEESKTFNALGLLEIQTKETGAKFIIDITREENSATLQGTFVLPTFNNLEIDLNAEKENFIKIIDNSDQGVYLEWKGKINVPEISFGETGWKLQGIEIDINTTKETEQVSALGMLKTPDGEMNIEFLFDHEGKLISGNANSKAGKDFTFFGIEVDVNNLDFIRDRNDDDTEEWDPKLEFQGKLTLPEELSSLEIEIQGDDNKLILTEDGLDFSGDIKLSLPEKQTLTPFGLLEIETQQAELVLSKEEDVKQVTLQGKFVIPSFNNAEIDLTEDKYILLKEDGTAEWKATIENIPDLIFTDKLPGWKLSDIKIDIDTTADKFETSAKLFTPQSKPDKGIDVNLVFKDGKLDKGTATSGAGVDFSFFGSDFDLSNATFIRDRNPDQNSEWEPELELQGKLILPELLSKLEVEVKGKEKLILNEEKGLHISGGVLKLPGTKKFEPFGLLSMQTKNAKLVINNSDSTTEAKLQGSFLIPTFNDAKVDLTKKNFIKIKDTESATDFEWKGTIDVPEILIASQLPNWKLVDIGVMVDVNTETNKNDISASAKLKTPQSEINLDLEFAQGNLKQITADSPQTGTDFTFLGVDVDLANLTFKPDVEAGNEDFWEPQFEFQGKLFLPQQFTGTTIDITGTDYIILNEQGIELSGTISVTEEKQFNALNLLELTTKNLLFNFDSKEKEVKLQGDFVLSLFNQNIDVDLKGNNHITLKETNNGLLYAMKADISVPNEISIFGDWKIQNIVINVDKDFNQLGSATGTAKLITSNPNQPIDLFLAFENGQLTQVTGMSPVGTDFTWFGTDVDIRNISFLVDRNTNDGEDWDPQIQLQGALTFPEQLSGLVVNITGDDKFLVDSDGFRLNGATLSLPGQRTFKPLGLLEIQSNDAELNFDFANETAKLQGEFIIPSLNNTTFDLTGNNAVTLRNTDQGLDLDWIGTISTDEISLFNDLSLQDVSLSVNSEKGSISGEASLQTSQSTIDLSIDFNQGKLQRLKGTGNDDVDFTFLGTDIDIQDLTLLSDLNPNNTDDWEPQATLQGRIILPDFFNNSTIEITNPNELIISENGVTLTGGKIDIPDFEFNLLNKLEVKAEDLSLEYASQNDAFKIQGKVSIPTLYNVVADFAGNNYIQIDNSGVDIVGSLSAQDIKIVPNVWEIKDVRLDFGEGDEIEGSGQILIPTGIVIEAGVGFLNGQLNQISLGVEDLNRPIGTTGLFLQDIAGEIDNVASSATQPTEFSGDLEITAGASIRVSLPSWAGGTWSGSLAELNVNGSINSNRMKANGNIEVLGGLLSGMGEAELNWDQGFLSASGEFNALGGLISSNSNFRATSNLDITMSGGTRIVLPEIFPWYLSFLDGLEIASANYLLNFSNDSNYSNDFGAIWGSVPYLGTGGIKVSFDGEWDIIGADEISSLPRIAGLSLQSQDSIYQKFSPFMTTEEFGLLNIEEEAFTVSSGTPSVLLGANWTGDNIVSIMIEAPDGTVYTEQDMDELDFINLIIDNNSTKLVQVQNPDAGQWTVIVSSDENIENLEFAAVGATPTNSIQIVDITDDGTGSNFTIDYQVNNATTGTVSLYYDNDNEGFDGVLIADQLPVDGTNINQYTWNTQGVMPDGYYIYAVLNEPNNIPVFDYFESSINLTQEADLEVSQTSEFQMLPRDGGDLENHLIYTVTVTNNGSSDSQGITLTETLPDGVTFISATVTPSEQNDNTLIFNLGDLAQNSSITLNITVADVTPSTPTSPDTIIANASVSSNTFDSDTSNNQTATVTVLNPPVVLNPIEDVIVNEDADNTTIDLTNIFSDSEGDIITLSITNNSNMDLVTATLDGNNLILDYQENQQGTAQITIRGTANGQFIEDTFTITVNPVEEPPIVSNPIADVSVDEDADNNTIDLTNVFSDSDGDAITLSILSNSNENLVSATLDANNLILDYQENQEGTAEITIRGTANDQFVDDTFTVTVNPLDDAPNLINPISDFTVDEDAESSLIDVSNVFSDVDGDAIALSIFDNSNADLVIANLDGNNLILDYQENQEGTAEITIRGTVNGQFVDDTFTVTVNPLDDSPIVANPIEDVIVNEDAENTTIDLTEVFSDLDGDPITISIFENDNTDLVTATLEGDNLILDYQDDQSGIAEITIRGIANGKFVDNTFIVSVNSLNDPPVVVNPVNDVEIDEDAGNTSIDLSNVFSDQEGDVITLSISNNSNEDLVSTTLDGNNLTLDYQNDQYGTAEITIQAEANSQITEETFMVKVNPVDDAPVVANPIVGFVVIEDADDSIVDLEDIFADVDGDTIIKSLFNNSNPALVLASIDGDVLTLNYQENQSGISEIILRGTANDKSVDDIFTVTVISVDDPLVVANPIDDVIVNEDSEDTSVDLSNVFSDIDAEDTISKSVFNNSNTNLVTVSLDGDNLTLDYQQNQWGTADITIRGASNGRFVDDVFTITVNPVDDSPEVFNPINDVTIDEDADNTIIDLNFVFRDIDGDEITLSVFDNSNPNLVTVSLDGDNLTLDYRQNQWGTADIIIRGASNGQFVDDVFTITVNPVDDPPEVSNPIDDVTVDEDADNTIIDLTNVFEDVDGDAIALSVLSNSNSNLVATSLNGNNLTLDYQDGQYGVAQIIIQGEANGKFVEDSFIVIVNQNSETEKVGDEFRVNTYTDNHQFSPSVAHLKDGGFVVTWTSCEQDGSGDGIYGQRYDSNGMKVDSEFRVNSRTDNHQFSPSVAHLKDGGFVVTWTSRGQDGSGDGVYGQRYGSNGSEVKSEFRVNSYTEGDQFNPSVTSLKDGGFLVTWTSRGQDGSGDGIYGQRYDNNGNKDGSEFLINTQTDGDQIDPMVTGLADGGFLIIWETEGDSNGNIYGQGYDNNGSKVNSEFLVSPYTFKGDLNTEGGQAVVTALKDGGFVVAWHSHNSEEALNAGIYAQRYDSNANAISPSFLVNTETFNQYFVLAPSITSLSNGGFNIIWESFNQDSPMGWGVFGQSYDRNGNEVGSEFPVNTYTQDYQGITSITGLDNGGLVATWTSDGQDSSLFGVYGQQFEVSNATENDNPPTLVNPINDISARENASDTIIDLSNVFNDVDGDTITKSILVNNNTNLVTANINGNTLTLDYQANQQGIAEITIIGEANGKFTYDTFKVTVIEDGDSTGDVHLKTLDGRYYDLQSFGEFILVESSVDDWVIQARQDYWVREDGSIINNEVSVNTAFATSLEGERVVFDLDFEHLLEINGIATPLEDNDTLMVGNSEIKRNGNRYTFNYAGTDGVLNTVDDDNLIAWNGGNHINLKVSPSLNRIGNLQGLLGNADGDATNDFQLENGTQLPSDSSWELLHGEYADSWRITEEESLFKVDTFAASPTQESTLDDFSSQAVRAATRAVRGAGIAQGDFFNGVVFDLVATNDINFLNAAVDFNNFVG